MKKPRNPMPRMAYTMALYPKIGLREKEESSCEVTPMPGTAFPRFNRRRLRPRHHIGAAAVFDHFEKVLFDRSLSQGLVVVQVADELPAQCPHIVDVFLDRLR